MSTPQVFIVFSDKCRKGTQEESTSRKSVGVGSAHGGAGRQADFHATVAQDDEEEKEEEEEEEEDTS